MDFLQMDSNRGFSTEGEKEEVLRWFPETPEKSIQMRQMSQGSQFNWLESLGFSPGLHQQTPSENGASACINSMDLAGSRRGLGPFKEFQTHDRMNTTTGVSNNISFLNLLALSSGTSSADVNLQGTHNAATNFFFPVDSGSNFSMNEHQSLSPVEFWNNKSEYLNAITDGGLPPVDHRIYDLNSPPKTIADCLWDGAQSTQSLPVTPDKSQLSNRTYSTSDEGSCREQEQELSTNPNMDEVVEINTGGSTQPMRHMHDLTQLQPENSHPLVDKSAAVLSNHDIDLNEAPQQKPRRKKHRPKVVIQGKPKRTRKQTNDKQNTAVKRKYVRKKGVANSETPSAQIVGEVPSQNSTMKSRKRVLDFNLEDQRREENQQTSLNDHEGFLYNSGKSSSAKQLVSLNSKLHSEGLCNAIGYGPGTKSTLQLGQGIEVTVSNTSAGFAYDLNCSLNQMINDYISLPETTGSAPQSTQRDPPVKNSYCIPTNKNDIKKPTSSLNNCGRITVVPSGKEMQSLSQCGLQSMSIDQFYPDCNLCIPFVGNEQARGSKRKYSRTIDKTDKNTMNLRGGTQHNSLQAYQELPQGFPEICKKRRTAKAQHISTTAANRVRWGQSLQSYHGTVNSQSKNMLGTNMLKYTIKKSVQDVFARPMNTKNCLAQDNTTDPLSFNRATFAELQASGFFINFCLTRRMTKKRSKGSKRARDWASLTAIPQCTQLPSRSLKTVPTRGERPGTDTTQRPLIRLEALVPENHAKKKRTRKVYPPINSMYPDDNQLHVRAKGSMDDQHQSLATTRGRSRVKRPNFATIDEIVHRLKHLDINRETRQTHDLGKNGSMVLYNGNGTMVPYNDNGTMVPYNDNGTMVPYERKRRPRPKVDLDPETEKVWKLLMGKPSSEPMEQTNEEKEKWWEEERRVFQGRADSFIARMHLVQGDRRFSKWKGSVVDSVVGVFLTQNVSDHLSSSAFMSLAARFPLQSKCNKQACCGEGIVAPLEELGVCTPDTEDTITWHENMPNQGVHHQDSMTLHEAAHFEGQEVANSNESFGSNLGYGSYTDITRHNESLPVCDSPGLSPGLLANITDNLKKNVGMVDFIREDRKTLEDAVSSQNSTASSIFQITERNGSCSSDSTSEAEDPVTQSPSKSSSDGLGGTFMELIQMGKNVMLQEEIYNYGSVSSTFNQSPHSEQNQSKGLDSDKHRSSTVNVDCLQDSFAYAYPPSSHLPHKQEHIIHSSTYSLRITPNSGVLEVPCPRMLGEETSSPLPSSASEIKHANSNCKQDALLQECASVLGKPSAGSESPNKHHTLRLDNLQLETCRERNPKSFNQQQKRVEALQSENTANKEPINLDHKLAGHQNSGMHQVPSSMNFSEVLADQENHKDDKTIQSDLEEQVYVADGSATGSTKNLKAKEAAKKKEFDWDSLRKHAYANGGKKERNSNTMDSVDWEAVRCADVNEIASAIKERGMNNMLAERIKAFLNRLVREHESIDLEWLRDAPPDQVKEYLLSVRGLGLKSVECVRLLTLHQLAFPVDTNVGRIAVRLGWVPLQPLPESLQLHLLEMYPVQETIQKYLWPRLCKLDQRTLYELHYQMITFGKVFCTKSKPNCNACPMRGECKHFASAFASARFALPAPEEKSMVSSTAPVVGEHNPTVSIYNQIGSTNTMLLRLPEAAKAHPLIEAPENEENRFEHIVDVPPMPLPLPEATEGCTLIEAPENKEKRCEPIVEVPATPERECTEISENDIEDSFYDDPDEIPTIKLNIEEFTVNLENVLNGYGMELQEGGMSQALVAMNPEAASIPVPKLKNVSRLRTEHQVYELPNSHPLLEGVDEREEDDPSTYLLAIWTPGETPESVQPRESSCGAQESGKLCNEETCFSCNNIRESTSQTVRGTLLIPCRTAMRGSFPLNGTYFQVNEVFADHDSSIKPIDVPRAWLWNLPRRTVYFGTSTSSIFRGLTTEEVQQCFWRGCICVRGFDQKNRAPRPLMARFHFPASRLTKTKINGIQNQN